MLTLKQLLKNLKVQGCKQSDDKSYAVAYKKHTDCSYAYGIKQTVLSAVQSE